MEKNVEEVQFLYAPKVERFAVLVSTDTEETVMSLEDFKQQYPLLAETITNKFNKKNNP
jgi:hypothetical protein